MSNKGADTSSSSLKDLFWNACGPSPHWQNSCVCVAAFAASQFLKGLKTCFSLSAASTDRFKLVFRGNSLCVPWNLGKGHVTPQWCHGRWEQAWVLSQLYCYQMADIICKTGRSARHIYVPWWIQMMDLLMFACFKAQEMPICGFKNLSSLYRCIHHIPVVLNQWHKMTKGTNLFRND